MQTIGDVVEWLMSETRAAALDEDETSSSIPGSGCTNAVGWDFHPMTDLLLALPVDFVSWALFLPQAAAKFD